MDLIYLAIAILFEIAGTVCLKLSKGFVNLAPTLAILPLYAVSFALLVLALRSIPLSTAYTLWAGLGTALVALIGFVYFHEPVTALKAVSFALIIVGVVGLHLSDQAVS